jgi:uncharacterized membrane protein YccC
MSQIAATLSPRRLAPDLAKLPIVHNLRALSVAEGVRAALAVAVIIALNEYFGLPALREAALAALWTCMADPGGPVRRRVPVLLSFAALGALITGLFGIMRGFGMPVALPVGVLALFAASFARVYGQAAQQVGMLLSMAIVLSLDQGLSVGQALEVSAGFLAGAVWATLLTLVIWRLYPYRATRQKVADVYHALAALTGDLSALLRDKTADDTKWEAHARAHRRAVRDAVEAARDSAMSILRGRGTGNLRAAQSLIRLETADQMFGALIALSELLEHGTPSERATAGRLLRRMRPLLILLAGLALSDEQATQPRVKRAIDAMETQVGRIPLTDPLRPIADRIVERLRLAHTLAVPANLPPGADPAGRRLALRERLARPLRANLTWRSPTLRHALRAAVMAAPALAYTMLWFTPYDHWLTMTLIATMQPFFALTYARAVERVIGTILGGVLAAAVGLLCTTPLSIGIAMFPLAVIALSIRAINFGLFMMALTPLVVLLVETGQPDTAEWRIALARATLTAIGGVLAVGAGFVLWPSREPERLVAGTREAIAAHGRYAEAELGALLDETQPATVDRSRREAGVASNALEASINRTLVERGGNRDLLEAVLVIDAALRRYAGRLSAMQLDPGLRDSMPPGALRAWRDWIVNAMRALAEGRTALPPRPEIGDADALRRLARQTELIAGALARLEG